MIPLAIIKRETARAFSMSVTEITARSRSNRIARPRMAAYLLSRELTDKSFPQIGRVWNRDHSTILYGAAKAGIYQKYYPEYARKVDRARRASANEIQCWLLHQDKSRRARLSRGAAQ